jgi:hypothetical protein
MRSWTRRVFTSIKIPLAMLALLAACSSDHRPPLYDAVSADEYAVWSAATDARFGSNHPRLVVEGETYNLTTAGSRSPDNLREYHSLSRELVDDYLARNDHPARVHAGRFAVKNTAVLPELDGLPGTVVSWASTGRLTVSRVGFDRGGTRALITVSYNCGGLCGEGAMLVLERAVHGEWRVTSTVTDFYF